jgi:hypothetical protein
MKYLFTFKFVISIVIFYCGRAYEQKWQNLKFNRSFTGLLLLQIQTNERCLQRTILAIENTNSLVL